MQEGQTDWGKLAEKATWETLTPQEIESVITKIKNANPETDEELGIWIYTLGRSSRYDQPELIEKFLYCPSNPDATKEAVRVLCSYWDLTPNYLDHIKAFIKGVEWDVDDDIRMQSILEAGNHIRKHLDIGLLHLLLDFFDNLGESTQFYESADYARALLKSCAYEALARAMGKNWNEIPDNDDIINDIENNETYFLDLSLLDQVRELVKKKGLSCN